MPDATPVAARTSGGSVPWAWAIGLVLCATVVGVGVGWLIAQSSDPPELRLARRAVLAKRRYEECEAAAVTTFYAAPRGASADLERALRHHRDAALRRARLTADDIVTRVVYEVEDSAEARLRKAFDDDHAKFVRQHCQHEEDELETMGLAVELQPHRIPKAAED
jgi:hypothetical protein